MRRLLAASFAVMLLFSSCSWAEDHPAVISNSDTGEESDSSADSESSEGTPQAQRVTFTIPEGYTLARIAMTLEEQGLCTTDAFLEAAQTTDFSSFPLVATQQPDDNRCWVLEGYLFPDTYEVYSTDPPDVIIRKMLDHTEQKITADMRRQIEQSGYTVDEMLTLASIIEKEALGHDEMKRISSVLHNRLDDGMQLQCDVTINYVEGAIKPFIDGDQDRFNDYYNTYKCPALPAGAICNPGMDAIVAALNPADTDFYYFVTDADQKYYYASTFSEHEENVAAAGIGAE